MSGKIGGEIWGLDMTDSYLGSACVNGIGELSVEQKRRSKLRQTQVVELFSISVSSGQERVGPYTTPVELRYHRGYQS